MIHDFDPVLINFGFIQVRWYSLAYVLGILIGWWYGKLLIKKIIPAIDQKKYIDSFDDLIGLIIIGVIFGGRIGYVLFYNPKYYLENMWEIIKLWEGGMSFHGGLLGVILAIYFFCKNKKLNFKIFFDIISCVAPIGIFLGRVANFINGELYGLPTNKSWGVIFPKVDNLLRHPSQLYEAALEGLVLFIILNLFLIKKNFSHGFLSFLFLILYGIFRIISEQFRQPDEQIGYIIGNFSMGTTLSILMIIFGLIFLRKEILDEKNK